MAFGRSNLIVGLDVGSATIKVVAMAPGEPFVIKHIAVGETPAGALKGGVATDAERLGAAIREVLAASGARGGRVVSAIAGEAVVVRELKLPPMPAATLAQAVQFEAGRFLPFSVQAAVLDYDVMGEVTEEGQKKLELLMVATRRETADRLLEAMHRAGVEPAIFDVEPFAIMRALGAGSQPDGQAGVFVNIGAETTDIVITEGKNLRLTRNVGFGGNEMTRALASATEMEFAAADAMKRTKGMILLEGEPAPDDAAVESVYNAIFPVVTDLAREVRRSMDYFQTRWRESRLERVVLGGGGARLKNLPEFLSLELGVQTVLGDPFAACQVPESVMPAAQRRELGPSMAAAVGLAMRGATEK